MKRKTNRKRRKVKSSQINSPIVYQGEIHNPSKIELIQYNESELIIKTLTEEESLFKERSLEKVNWLNISSLSNVEYIKQLSLSYGLHTFDVRDILSDQDVVKVVEYDQISFVLLPVFSYCNNTSTVETQQIGFILGDNYLISMQESNAPIFDEVIMALKDKHFKLIQRGPDFLLYTLLSEINTLNLNAIIQIENRLLDMEDVLLEGKNENIDVLIELREYRIAYIKIKRALLSIREEYSNLQRNTNKLINDSNEIYFNDLDDKVRTSIGDLESCHELLASILDLYYNNTNLKMNEIMKRLTLVATIFIPLTFFVGVWGMNFENMPELKWEYGYHFAWGVFITIIVLALFIMQRKKWF